MKRLVSPAVLNGPALDHMVYESVEQINKVGSIQIDINDYVLPTKSPSLLVALMDRLKIDLFWHEEYNGVEQSVVEADCTIAGPVREACEIDAVAADVMTAVYRAVIIYTFGNEVQVQEHILADSEIGTGINDGKVDMAEPATPTIKTRRGWRPWYEAADHIGKKVILRFANGHIEDATIHLNTDTGAYYYMLFDGDTLETPVKEFMLLPDTQWKNWHECRDLIENNVLIKFESGHIEDATLSQDADGSLIYSLFDGQIMSENPVSARPIPA